MEPLQWLTAALCAFLIGVAKTGVPGVAILGTTLMAAVMPAKASTGFVLPLLIVGDIYAVIYYRRNAVWKHLIPLFPWAVVGVVIGYFLMGRVTDSQLRPIIGVIVLIVLGLSQWKSSRDENSLHIPSHWSFAAAAGLAAGITTMMANAAGPIMAIYLLAMRLPKTEFIGTGAWYFLFVNLLKVPFSADLGLITSTSLGFDAILTPVVIVGAALGVYLLKVIPERVFKNLVVVFAAAAAIKLLF